MKLYDLKKKAEQLRLGPVNEKSRYVIQCCGYEMMVEDDSDYHAMVEALLELGSFDSE